MKLVSDFLQGSYSDMWQKLVCNKCIARKRVPIFQRKPHSNLLQKFVSNNYTTRELVPDHTNGRFPEVSYYSAIRSRPVANERSGGEWEVCNLPNTSQYWPLGALLGPLLVVSHSSKESSLTG